MAVIYFKIENQKIIIDTKSNKKLKNAIIKKQATLNIYVYRNPIEKGIGKIGLSFFEDDILTGDFIVKEIDSNLEVSIENMTIKFSAKPDFQQRALSEDAEFYLAGFNLNSMTYPPIGGTLKEEKFIHEYYDSLEKKQVKEEDSRYKIELQVSSKKFKQGKKPEKV